MQHNCTCPRYDAEVAQGDAARRTLHSPTLTKQALVDAFVKEGHLTPAKNSVKVQV